MTTCSTCKKNVWGQHKCHQQWLVWNPDQSETVEDAKPIYAMDALSAAEDWAEQDDNSADYCIAKGQPATVCVQRVPDGPVEKFRVSGECQAVYMAEPIEVFRPV